MTRTLGLDLGGTNVKVAVVDDRGGVGPTVVAEESHRTHADRGPAAVMERLLELGAGAIERHGSVDAVGIGVPGLFDPVDGRVVLFPNLPGEWEGQPLRQRLAAGLGLPVHLINDARAFTLAEGTVGAGRGCDTLVCLTLGTGVGGGVMIGGRLHLGTLGRAGEIGHQIVLPDGPICGCGAQGCAEALTRADVLADMAGRTTVEEVYAGAVEGDERCLAAVESVAGYLGIALANTVVVLGPDRIVVGGGISVAGEALLGPLRRAVRSRVSLVPPEAVDIAPAALGPMAGAIGAALVASTTGGRRGS